MRPNVCTVHHCPEHCTSNRYPVSGIQISDSRSRSQIDPKKRTTNVCGRTDDPHWQLPDDRPLQLYSQGDYYALIRSILKYIGKIRARHLPQWCTCLWDNVMMYPLNDFYSGNRREKETLRRFSELYIEEVIRDFHSSCQWEGYLGNSDHQPQIRKTWWSATATAFYI